MVSAPTNLDAEEHADGVLISWDNTDNSTSGGYTLHRFERSDVFAFAGDTTAGGFNDGSWTEPSVITRSIGATDTSYVDTNPSENDVEYRLYRYDSNETVPSDLIPYSPPLYLTRSVSVSGTGAVSNKRILSKTRSASINATGRTETVRNGIDKTRNLTISGGNGDIDTIRSLLKPRSPSVYATGKIKITRDGSSKGRNPQIYSQSGEIDTIRSVLKSRQPVIDGNGSIQTSREKQTERTTEYDFNTGSVITLFDLQEVFPDEEALDVSWDYEFEPRGFVTEWFDETSEIPREQRGGFGVTFFGRLENEIELWIQHDTGGPNGEILTSDKQTVSQTQQTVTFDTRREFYDDGLFRVFVRGLRQEDVINQVDIGTVHENL